MNANWVAIGDDASSNAVLKWSEDGQTWYNGSGSFGPVYVSEDSLTNICYGVAFDGSGTWIAVGNGPNPILISTDGKSWNPVTLGFDFVGFDIDYSNGVWIAVGSGSVTTMIGSTDGQTWSDIQPSNILALLPVSIASDGNGKWIAGGDFVSINNNNNKQLIMSTDNGTTWSVINIPFLLGASFTLGITSNGKGSWIASVHYETVTGDVPYIRSTDGGVSWSPLPGVGSNIYGLYIGFSATYVNENKLVMVGAGVYEVITENWMLRSDDGGNTNTNFSSPGYPFAAYDVASDSSGTYVTVGKDNATILAFNEVHSQLPTTGGFYSAGYAVSSRKKLPYIPPPPCFVQGSRVLTPSGYKKIEDLESGSPILTADNRIVPIKLYSFTTTATTETAPYRIPVGALGANIPIADLHVSPRHAVQDSKGRWQIPKYLGKKSQQYGIGEPVTYYHIECPNYYTDNVIVEGTVVESFKNKQGLPGVTYIWNGSGWDRTPPNKTIEVPKKPSTYMIYSQ